MNFELTETQKTIRKDAIEFAQKELAGGEINPTFDRDGWRMRRLRRDGHHHSR
ncbi:MAG: hypothetical protein IPK83_04440 [Planctomycetes bacterium]|nr:hypothetical protein [Planctomycetota bacterium]